MKALIIEDELPAAQQLQKLLQMAEPEMEILDHLDSVRKSVEWLKHNDTPDIIFMDIQLSDDVSFSIFQQTEVKSPVIFTTAYDEYALQAFKVNSVDYLLKPVDIEELKAAIDKWKGTFYTPSISKDLSKLLLQQIKGQKEAYKSRFLVKKGEQFLSVPIEEVMYFTSENKVTFLYTTDLRKYFIDSTLEELETLLDPARFFRLNRQCITSVEAIDQIHSYFNSKLKIYLKNGEDPYVVSKEKAPVFKQWLNR